MSINGSQIQNEWDYLPTVPEQAGRHLCNIEPLILGQEKMVTSILSINNGSHVLSRKCITKYNVHGYSPSLSSSVSSVGCQSATMDTFIINENSFTYLKYLKI